jgi:hypothetical protein
VAVELSETSDDGVRRLLIADREESLERWPVADEFLDDLRARVPVTVSSADLLRVLMNAGLPPRQFAYGGADWGRVYVLDGRDRLTEAPTTPGLEHGDYRHVVRWYRETLPNVPPPPPARWEPVKIGPTWDWSPKRGWLLPEHSMGWEVLGWCGHWLRNNRGEPWQFTPEQARFVLFFHAIDTDGRLLNRTAVYQRIKGHGKNPLAAALLGGW